MRYIFAAVMAAAIAICTPAALADVMAWEIEGNDSTTHFVEQADFDTAGVVPHVLRAWLDNSSGTVYWAKSRRILSAGAWDPVPFGSDITHLGYIGDTEWNGGSFTLATNDTRRVWIEGSVVLPWSDGGAIIYPPTRDKVRIPLAMCRAYYPPMASGRLDPIRGTGGTVPPFSFDINECWLPEFANPSFVSLLPSSMRWMVRINGFAISVESQGLDQTGTSGSANPFLPNVVAGVNVWTQTESPVISTGITPIIADATAGAMLGLTVTTYTGSDWDNNLNIDQEYFASIGATAEPLSKMCGSLDNYECVSGVELRNTVNPLWLGSHRDDFHWALGGSDESIRAVSTSTACESDYFLPGDTRDPLTDEPYPGFMEPVLFDVNVYLDPVEEEVFRICGGEPVLSVSWYDTPFLTIIDNTLVAPAHLGGDKYVIYTSRYAYRTLYTLSFPPEEEDWNLPCLWANQFDFELAESDPSIFIEFEDCVAGSVHYVLYDELCNTTIPCNDMTRYSFANSFFDSAKNPQFGSGPPWNGSFPPDAFVWLGRAYHLAPPTALDCDLIPSQVVVPENWHAMGMLLYDHNPSGFSAGRPDCMWWSPGDYIPEASFLSSCTNASRCP